MKKNNRSRLAVCLYVAALSTFISNPAKAEMAEASAVSGDTSLSLLQNIGNIQQDKPVIFAPTGPIGTAPQTFTSGKLPGASTPIQSFDPVRSYSVIPEPTTAALLVGLGVLVGFKRLKIGRSN